MDESVLRLTESSLINKEIIGHLCGYPVVCLAIVGLRGRESRFREMDYVRDSDPWRTL